MTINEETDREVEIMENGEVQIEIIAKDAYGLPITKAKGRFLELSLSMDGVVLVKKETSFKEEPSPRFFLKLSNLELNKAGKYKYNSACLCMCPV